MPRDRQKFLMLDGVVQMHCASDCAPRIGVVETPLLHDDLEHVKVDGAEDWMLFEQPERLSFKRRTARLFKGNLAACRVLSAARNRSLSGLWKDVSANDLRRHRSGWLEVALVMAHQWPAVSSRFLIFISREFLTFS